MKRRRELGPLRHAEVLPFRELLLEREQLLRGERRPRLPVRLVFPQVALDLGRLAVLCNRKRVPLEDHPSSLSFIAAHEPDREPQRARVGAATRVSTGWNVGHPGPKPCFEPDRKHPVFAAVLDPAQRRDQDSDSFFSFFFSFFSFPKRGGGSIHNFPAGTAPQTGVITFLPADRRIPAANRPSLTPIACSSLASRGRKVYVDALEIIRPSRAQTPLSFSLSLSFLVASSPSNYRSSCLHRYTSAGCDVLRGNLPVPGMLEVFH